MFEYHGATALVTGASKGIGVAFAENLAARGVHLVLVARSLDRLKSQSQRLSEKYGIRCIVLDVDLSKADAVARIGASLDKLGIEVDLLINNAGLGISGNFLSSDPGKERTEVEVNIQAVVSLTYLLGRPMQHRGSGGIINVASNASFQPVPAMAVYAATKSFVLHFTEALAYELAPDGVRVMATCPGPTATCFFEGTPTNLTQKDLENPDTVVRRTLAAFDRGKSIAYPTRTSVRLAMLLPRLLPRSLVTRLIGWQTHLMGLH